MKKHIVIGFLALIIVGIIPAIASAMTLQRGMGGRVIVTPPQLQSAIVCAAAYGPFMMLSYNVAPSGPYFIRTATLGIPRQGGHLLSLYRTTLDMGTCYNPETGAAVPAFELTRYGVSR